MFFLAPDEFGIRILSQKLSNSIIRERSKLFKSNDSGILENFSWNDFSKLYVDLLVSSSIEQIEVDLAGTADNLLDLGRFDEFFRELFEQDSSESEVNLEFFQLGGSLIKKLDKRFS